MCQFNHPNVTRLIGVVTQSKYYSISQPCFNNSTKKVPTHPLPPPQPPPPVPVSTSAAMRVKMFEVNT